MSGAGRLWERREGSLQPFAVPSAASQTEQGRGRKRREVEALGASFAAGVVDAFDSFVFEPPALVLETIFVASAGSIEDGEGHSDGEKKVTTRNVERAAICAAAPFPTVGS